MVRRFRVTVDGRVICKIYLDAEEIAKGIFDLMEEECKTLLSFGMINRPVMDILDKVLADKFDEIFEQKFGMNPDDADKYITDLGLGVCTDACTSRKAFVRQVSCEASKHLYSVAKDAGIMVV